MSSSLPPWSQMSFSFGWNANLTSDTYTLPGCFNTTWQYWGKLGDRVANPPPSPPYHVVVYSGGNEPYMLQLNNSAATGQTNWIANLPAGSTRYGVSMLDSKNYTGGILEHPLVMTSQAACNTASPLKPSSLDVEVTGNSQCQLAIINIKNGTAPYKLEVVPIDGVQKTIYYASSPFGVKLDMPSGLEYFLAVYDSTGNSGTLGSFFIDASSDNSCLGEAATVTAGAISTLYPGGTTTAVSSATAAPTSAHSNGLATPAIIGIAVGVPIAAIILTALLLWCCYKQNHRRDPEEKPEIDPGVSYIPTGYTPVPTTATHYTGSYHDVSTTGHYNPPVPIPYSLPTASDRHTIGGTSISEPSSTAFSEKRRHLINPDAHDLGPVTSEPFDPNSISGASGSRLPPLPPAYSPSS